MIVSRLPDGRRPSVSRQADTWSSRGGDVISMRRRTSVAVGQASSHLAAGIEMCRCVGAGSDGESVIGLEGRGMDSVKGVRRQL